MTNAKRVNALLWTGNVVLIIGDYTAPWVREWAIAVAHGVESVVLFALDQFCLIGYPAPLARGAGRSSFMGTA